MGKITFILGGARSGKSSYAVKLAKSSGRKVAFIATCIFTDSEMKKRIKLHKRSRPAGWKVVEEGVDIGSVLSGLEGAYDVILIDCLGLFVTNLLAKRLTDKQIERRIKELRSAISTARGAVIVASNDVGSGIVPDNLLARRFRDLLGMTNQMMAAQADEVIFMQAGIPLIIKGEKE